MSKGLRALDSVVASLLGPRGCPWDRAQTHRSLIPFLKEEARELEIALKRGRWHEIEDELGDLLFHILFHARLGAKGGRFDFETVARSQAKKLKRRHPHVFGARAAFKDAEEVLRHWKTIKAGERALRAREVAERDKKARRRR